MASAMRPHRDVVRNVRDMTYAYKSSLYIDVVRCLVIPRLVYRISKYLEHRATFTARYPVALALKRLDPLGTKFVSRFSPGVVVKFGFDHDAEVRALQFIHGQLSVHTPRVLHHAPFPKLPVVEPWHWEGGVWYFFMEGCPGVPLDTVIGNVSSTELDHIADQLLVILDEMRSYKSTTLGAVTGGPYRNRNMPYPWQPPHAFSNVKE